MPLTGASSGSRPSSSEIAGQLLDAVDLAAPLDLDRDMRATGVAAEQVDRADRGRVLAAHQREPVAEHVRRGGQQLLQVCLDAVLHQTRIDAQLVRRVVEDLLQRDPEFLAGLVDHAPHARRASSSRHGGLIQFSGLYARSSAWIETEPSAFTISSRVAVGQMRRQPADVVDRAAGNHETHRDSLNDTTSIGRHRRVQRTAPARGD